MNVRLWIAIATGMRFTVHTAISKSSVVTFLVCSLIATGFIISAGVVDPREVSL